MLIKVCGMKQAQNISLLSELRPDFIGFIFYDRSPRYIHGAIKPEILRSIPGNIVKTGVFVNTKQSEVMKMVERYSLDAVQLHGNESPHECSYFKERGLTVIKVFHPKGQGAFKSTVDFEPFCDYFLFDTPSVNYGGTGRKFDWSVLEQYKGSLPFFVSGGIGPDDEKNVLKIENPRLAGVDVNSGFETEPGLKNIPQLGDFFNNIRKEKRRH